SIAGFSQGPTGFNSTATYVSPAVNMDISDNVAVGSFATSGSAGTRSLLLGDDAQQRALRLAYGGTATSPLFVAGRFDGTITLGATPFTNQGGLDVFLAKLDETANITAAAAFGSTVANMDEEVRGIVTDASTNVFVVGTLRGQATLGT